MTPRLHATTRANGQLAVGCYLYSADTGTYQPAVIDVLTLAADEKISAVTAFVLVDELCADPAAVFDRFGLPAAAPAGADPRHP